MLSTQQQRVKHCAPVCCELCGGDKFNSSPWEFPRFTASSLHIALHMLACN